jgi:hypothetical protein
MRGGSLLNMVILLLAAAASAIYWAARPYLVTYLLAAVCFYLLQRWYKTGKGNLWLLPVLMIVWVNSHGGYLAGFLLLAPYLFDAFLQWLSVYRLGENTGERAEKLRRLLQISLLSLAATLLNPAGLGLWTLPFTTVKRVAEQLFIAEWQSPDFHQPYLLPFLIILALTMFAVAASKKRTPLHEALLLAGFGALGLYSVRNIFFFVIVAPAVLSPCLGDYLQSWKEKLNLQIELDFDQTPSRIQSVLNWGLLGLFALVAFVRVSAFLPSEENWEIISEQFPAAAVDFIHKTQPEGRLFNAYNFGGYCIWALPEYPVFVDGRADLHGDEVILEWYRTVNLAGDWKSVLADWDVGVVFLEPNQPLAAELAEQGWQIGYQDEIAVVLLRE